MHGADNAATGSHCHCKFHSKTSNQLQVSFSSCHIPFVVGCVPFLIQISNSDGFELFRSVGDLRFADTHFWDIEVAEENGSILKTLFLLQNNMCVCECMLCVRVSVCCECTGPCNVWSASLLFGFEGAELGVPFEGG